MEENYILTCVTNGLDMVLEGKKHLPVKYIRKDDWDKIIKFTEEGIPTMYRKRLLELKAALTAIETTAEYNEIYKDMHINWRADAPAENIKRFTMISNYAQKASLLPFVVHCLNAIDALSKL